MEISTFLFDQVTKKLQRVVVWIGPLGIEIQADGYGDAGTENGFGTPIFIEKYDGELRVCLWDDINEQEPKVTDMEGAKESLRKD